MGQEENTQETPYNKSDGALWNIFMTKHPVQLPLDKSAEVNIPASLYRICFSSIIHESHTGQ